MAIAEKNVPGLKDVSRFYLTRQKKTVYIKHGSVKQFLTVKNKIFEWFEFFIHKCSRMIKTNIKEGILRELQIKQLYQDRISRIKMYAVENVIQNPLKTYVISREENGKS